MHLFRLPRSMKIVAHGALALVAAMVLSVTTAADAQAAQQLVRRECNLGPRGDACAYLIHDPVAKKLWAKGAVNPKNGHRWRIENVLISRCYDECLLVTSSGSSGYSTQPQSRATIGIVGSTCYGWYATVYYSADSNTGYEVVTQPVYGGRC